MSNLKSRVRTCDNCEKPLGSTLVYCYECQSDESVASDKPTEEDWREDSMNDVWAAKWKLQLSVNEDLVFEQHDYDVVSDYL